MTPPPFDPNSKIREYHNLLSVVSNTLYAIRHQTNLSYDDKIKALDYIQKAVPEIKRYLIYLHNTHTN